MDKNPEKAGRLSVCWPLDRFKTSEDARYDEIVSGLFEQMKESTPALPKGGVFLQNLLDHIKVIVCNLHCAHNTDPALYIEFRRDGSAYKAEKSYAGFQFSSNNVRRVTKFLHVAGYIELHTGYAGSSEYRRQLSKMCATEKLLDLLDDTAGADPETIYRNITHVETVVMKGKKKGRERKRAVLKTPDRPIVRQMRSNLAIINEALSAADIDIDMDQHEREELNARLSSDPDKYKRPIDFTQKHLYRIFVDGSLKRHGRFYGGWWIGIPEEYRERIVINGMPVVELDFSGLHPHILYALAGAELPEVDPYKLPGFPDTEAMRKLLKRFLLMIVNAESPTAAKGALRQAYAKDARKARRRAEPAPLPPVALTDETLDSVTTMLRRRHMPIQYHFFSGMGNELMYHDSQMAEEIMLHFAGKGIPCLPVHDSFILDLRYGPECLEQMRRAFEWRFGQEIPIDYQDIFTVHQRHRQGAVPYSDLWNEMDRDLTAELKLDW